MAQKIKIIVGALAFAFVIAGSAAAYNILSKQVKPENGMGVTDEQGKVSQSDENEKQKAPDFTMFDKDGKSVKLSDMIGKPVVLNFWASWCPPCKGEMPEFDKIYKEFGQVVQFMMVDLTDGQRETKEKGADYVKSQGFSFPVYFDTEQEGAYAYEIQSIPTTLFINKDGNIVTVARGAIDEVTLRKGIEAIR